MAEYIDREALLQKVWDADTRIGYVQVVDVGDILDMPVADVAPVVRCKDCKYYYECGVNFCDRLGMDCPGDSDFFCSYGERKNGGDNDGESVD